MFQVFLKKQTSGAWIKNDLFSLRYLYWTVPRCKKLRDPPTDILFLSLSLCNDFLTVYARSESIYLATSYEK